MTVNRRKGRMAFSKQLVRDIRALLWVVTVGGLVLAGLCVWKGFTGSLPWLSAMVGLPWTAHGVVCSFYLNMAKREHMEGGITFEAEKAKGFPGNHCGKCRPEKTGADGAACGFRQSSVDSPEI